MSMADIRDEFGAGIYQEKITADFIKSFDGVDKNELRSEIDKVRSENYEPILMEMSLALLQVGFSRAVNALDRYQYAMQLSEAQIGLGDARCTLQEKINEYLANVPAQRAKKGGDTTNARFRKGKQAVFDWLDANLSA